EHPSKITGYAAVFNSKTTIGGWFDEVIEPGAFARSLSENGDIRALFNHNWDNVLGRTKSGTLRLEEDEKGLKFEIELPNTSVGRDLAESMSRGDINQCSFGFWITEENWDYNVEPALRTIKEVELYEISVVSIPAYDDTEVSLVRSKEIGKEIEQRMKMIKQINQILEGK
ncbi:HK97 family phage prohead protease, partial [Bacillus thuringiensis]